MSDLPTDLPTDFTFRLDGTDGAARTGAIATPRGIIRTPAFMPVGTAGDRQGDVSGPGAGPRRRRRARQHLPPDAAPRPRADGAARRPAPLHETGTRPILTDSGGFQVMSLSALRKIDEAGRHLPLACRRLDPSHEPGALDRDPGPARLRHPDAARRMRAPAGRARRRSRRRCTCRCAGPSAAAWPSASSPARRCSASSRAATCRRCGSRARRALVDLDLKGYAIGGLAVGEPQAVMLRDDRDGRAASARRTSRATSWASARRTTSSSAVARGIDMFDCVMPTRAGRHGLAYTRLRPDQPAQCPPRRGHAAPRRGLVLPGGARLQPRLSPPPRAHRRDPGDDAAHLEQPRLLPGPDGRHPRGDRARAGSPISRPRPARAGPGPRPSARPADDQSAPALGWASTRKKPSRSSVPSARAAASPSTIRAATGRR